MSFTKPPIIILTPGKVGSSSIYSTLKKELPNRVFHIHNLSERGIEDSSKAHLESERNSEPLHLIVSRFLQKKLSFYSGRIFVITIVREPISREISSFFQNTEFYKSKLEGKNLEIDVDKAHKILNQKLKTDICKNLEHWFNLEIENNLGIDVFSKPFEFEKKYMIFRNESVDLLLMRLEDLNEAFSGALNEFLHIDSQTVLENTNIGNSKHYAKTYKKIQKRISLDSTSLDNIINSRYFKHFYTHDEKKVMQKWNKTHKI